MRQIYFLLVAVYFLPTFLLAGDIILHMGSGLSDADFSNLTAFAKANMPLSVQVGTPASSDGNRSEPKAGRDVALVNVTILDSITDTNLLVVPMQSLDLRAVRAEYGVTDKSSSSFVTNCYCRELMKMVGVLLGLKKGCANPHCAMSEYQKEGFLALGCNYCPACLGLIELKYVDRIGGERRR